ncbi:hypothetical protein CYLTODRAFT_460484 [Cylindrobasidium torrendii FP15055 ss-10]|uniref:DUF6589 domain-containing protein n=1 Tax=Cylindrobasidium torrendii FP15055 ss-10 TaxID=1314674 RepID=A0A0D7AQW1_9AGAR|nr:hypothetical protein CYLTODRAFT_460484 [Cylindrobasidium torrendii FP15055 ss-10]
MPSSDRLEALGIKEIEGPTRSGNAVTLLHHLMTLRVMRHAISMGHPSRILTILKHWIPMFYAAKSYNYAQEMMELLCNLVIDWPDDTAQVMQFAHLEELTNNLFDALGVQSANKRHTKVQQHDDVALMAAHLVYHGVFSFDARIDVKASPLTDLYHQGIIGLHGEKGGFSGHLARFKLRQRRRWILAQAVEDELQEDTSSVEHFLSDVAS